MLLALLLVLLCTSAGIATPKKGFGLCGRLYKCGDTFALSGTSWWYNWHYSREEYHWKHCSKFPRGEFVPMIWSEKYLHVAKIPADAKHVLGFNEPNAKNQANLTPERAAQLWPQVEKLAGNRILISPAPYGCDNNPDMCIQWFERFFKACHKCRVDRIAVHGYHCDSNKMIDSLLKIYNKFKKRIWLTEFACTASNSVDHYISFLHDLVPKLEHHWAIERYAWFCSRGDQSSSGRRPWNLLNMDSPTLSRLGQVYNSVQ
ncbi:hypothetical protein LOTGIDRAFT_231190 [Lottia gigantea]|uniref:Asl1-like glycosyl hydrolase catalytic domain-containing protein n=1 Tax=Lottia gigantea TaxID=225164 RepID=V4A4G8_LOTGI|nr:hypothetical protein LOTGIDRAFT_231190 [Lottia gigantea]ESO98813.1 hypothetical protein LOTGIDRAFT_231190 [Lottia gigantea]